MYQLHAACYVGNTAGLKKLLQAGGTDVNQLNDAGWRPLHLAIVTRNLDCMALLLAQPGIDVNATTDPEKTIGVSPLHYACCARDNGKCLSMLLDMAGDRIDLNQRNYSHETALTAYYRHQKDHTLLPRLLELGATE